MDSETRVGCRCILDFKGSKMFDIYRKRRWGTIFLGQVLSSDMLICWASWTQERVSWRWWTKPWKMTCTMRWCISNKPIRHRRFLCL